MPNRLLQREQGWLMPKSLEEQIPPDHSCRFAAALVDRLDGQWWREFGELPGGALTGPAAYSPDGLLGVWIYGFMIGIRSTRKLERACREQIPFMWLAGYQQPDHNTLWRFYDEHRDQMRNVFKWTVGVAVHSGLLDLALQAVDGTKIEANAARDQNRDKEQLAKLLAKATDRVIAELEQAGGSDEPTPAALPEGLQSAQALQERLQEAERLLEEEELPAVSLTDPDARFMKPGHGQITMAYNAQAMVSALGEGGTVPFITAAEVTQEANDSQQLLPMIEAAEANGVHAEVTAADGGYHTGAALAACAEQGRTVVMPADHATPPENPYDQEYFAYDESTDSYRCPEGQTLGLRKVTTKRGVSGIRIYSTKPNICRSCPAFGQCTKNQRHGRRLQVSPYKQAARQHRDRMERPEAKALLGLRGQLVEPVFGIIKEQMGGRRFLTRGLAKVRAEWCLLATGYNLRALYGIWRRGLFDGPFGSPCRPRGVSCTRFSARPHHFRTLRRRIHRPSPALPAPTTSLRAAA